MNAIIRLKDVKLHVGTDRTIDIPNLEVLEGETVAIIGDNGSGKLTLLKAIEGFIKIKEGYIIRSKNSVLVPQYQCLFQRLTIDQHISLLKQRRGFKINKFMFILQQWEVECNRTKLGGEGFLVESKK